MTHSLTIQKSFLEVAKRYRVIFFDAYGVLKNSTGIIEGVPSALARFRDEGLEFFVITNDASRSPKRMSQGYTSQEHGVLIPPDRAISSGMMAREFLRSKVREGRVAYLGKETSVSYIEEAGLEAVAIADVGPKDTVKALVLLDDEGFDWFGDINRAVNLLRRLNVPVVVANTDLAYPVGGGQVAVAVGSLGNMLEGILHKTFIRFGKPDTQIFSFALARARKSIPGLQKSQILMVGDTLETDILGANKFGIDSALVLSGNTQGEEVELLVGSTGIIPDFVFPSINC